MVIDDEFRKLIPPLTTDEYTLLEKSIIDEGVRDPVLCWCGVIIDGHNRYEITQKHGLSCPSREVEFTDRSAVMIWIIQNQFGRRNLSMYQRAELALKLEPLIRERAKKNQIASGGAVPQKSAEPVDTRAVLASLASVSHDTIMKVKKIDTDGPEDIKEKLRDGNLTINSAYKIVKKEEQKKRVADSVNSPPPPTTKGKYRVFYADPPWKYGIDQHSSAGTVQEKTIGSHYPSMPTDEICGLPIKEMAEENAVLFLWATSPLILHAFRVMEAWGFQYKAQMIWDKVLHNVGHYVSVRHEILLIGTRGSCTPDVKKLYDSVYTEERTEHSKKPEFFRTVIDNIYPLGRRVELFARDKNDDWDAWGNQL